MADYSEFFPKAGSKGDDYSEFFPPAQQEGPRRRGAQEVNAIIKQGRARELVTPEDLAMADPTRDMSGTERFLAGSGKFFKDVGRRGEQLIAPSTPMSDMIAKSPIQREIDESRTLDAPLMRTGAGLAGNLTAGVLTSLPTAFVPGANTYTGAALAGGLMGALNPVATGESGLTNVAMGAGLGIGGQAVGNTVGRVMRPVRSTLGPEAQQLANVAQREGIPLSVGQQTGSRPMQITESVMENLPFTSGRQLAQRQAQNEAYNAAVLRTGGMNATAATPTVLAAQKQAVGGELGNIAKNNSLDFEQGLRQKLSGIVADAYEHLPPDKAANIDATVKQILSGAPPGTPAQQVASPILSASGSPFSSTIPATPAKEMLGTVYQGWREPLRGLASNSEFGRYYSQIRTALDDAFRTQLPGAEGQRFRDLSGQYSNVKTIADAMGGAGAATKVGDIPPAQLEAALTKQVGREGKALGRGGPLNELVGVGRQFISDQVPNSGTAQRQLIQSLLTTGGGTGLGAGAAYASGNDPMKGALVGAGLTAGGLLSPRLFQGLMQSPAGREYLSRGILAMTPQQQAILNAASRGVLSLPLVNAMQQ